MTTKPKAKKFRIRRSPAAANAAPRPASAAGAMAAAARSGPRAGAAATAEEMPFADDHDDGFGDAPYPTAPKRTEVSAPSDASAENEIAAIRKEGLTGRQLRMARRVAQKHGLAPTSDFDAVRLLRKQGIDPFQRSNMLELVVPGQERKAGSDIQLPKTVDKPQLPSTEVLDEDNRAREIVRMQREIARRRRRKLMQLAARLAFFVLLPTFLAGWYYFRIATPMYATHSEFVIQQAQNPAAAGASGLAGMFSGTSFATSQDSIAVQGYLQSIDAMLRLDEDLGFREHFSDPDIDPLQRLDVDATKEEAYKIYKKNVKISYDPTEGIIKMDVVAADPELSQLFSERLIQYAEEQVDALSLRLREDQMEGARQSYEKAENAMLDAQQRVLSLQEKLGVLDPMTESNALMTRITNLETQLSEKRLQLQQLLDNERPNEARVEGARGDVRRLEAMISELRSQLTETTEDGQSLARITGELRLAERELQTRELMVTQALQQLETARIEANRQTRYLSMAVAPIAPDEATYPRSFENTVLAFLIFGGVYLMISLTAAILREQVSS
ncbi:capsule biosynthesis protein [Psychromarinibacter sp. C21-152]|uniref:Capsule biosynthesis protein n=1 Tax=Psychromarinibacter sediminicola TaxID=3033385 RepID=A0AAE3NQ23_9RHOB|nr:capsule biosynthesis protein [Psychromarinibacter sediminicola]MDF0600336.1 capsule biosynthesis protein [Psychromarinibacter sediminicola]